MTSPYWNSTSPASGGSAGSHHPSLLTSPQYRAGANDDEGGGHLDDPFQQQPRTASPLATHTPTLATAGSGHRGGGSTRTGSGSGLSTVNIKWTSTPPPDEPLGNTNARRFGNIDVTGTSRERRDSSNSRGNGTPVLVSSNDTTPDDRGRGRRHEGPTTQPGRIPIGSLVERSDSDVTGGGTSINEDFWNSIAAGNTPAAGGGGAAASHPGTMEKKESSLASSSRHNPLLDASPTPTNRSSGHPSPTFRPPHQGQQHYYHAAGDTDRDPFDDDSDLDPFQGMDGSVSQDFYPQTLQAGTSGPSPPSAVAAAAQGDADDDWDGYYQADDGYWYEKDEAYYSAVATARHHHEPQQSNTAEEQLGRASPHSPNPLLDSGSWSSFSAVNNASGGVATTVIETSSPKSASSPSSAGGPPRPIGLKKGSGSTLSASSPPGGVSSPTDPGKNLKFRKIRELGRGAFGEVFLAMNILTGELMAVKQVRIDENVDSKLVRDAQREINVMVRLPEHPNCVKYIGSQEKGKYMHIFMEVVSGGSVESLLRATKQHFHEATIQQYAFMVLLGLQHLHEHHIVHQDIKGANVLVDTNGIAKIADFGCCKDLSAMHMNSSKTAGSPLFMAPEVCRGNPADTRSDIWSFGCFMLEMAKDDRCPWAGFQDMGLFAVIYAISAATKPPEIPNHLSPICRDFIGKCLMLDPEARATIEELLLHPFFTTEFDEDELEPMASCVFDPPAAEEEASNSLMSLNLKGSGYSGASSTGDGVVNRMAGSPILSPHNGGGVGGAQQAGPPSGGGGGGVGDSHLLYQFSLRSTDSAYDSFAEGGGSGAGSPSSGDGPRSMNPLKDVKGGGGVATAGSPSSPPSAGKGGRSPQTPNNLYDVENVERRVGERGSAGQQRPPPPPPPPGAPIVFRSKGGGVIGSHGASSSSSTQHHDDPYQRTSPPEQPRSAESSHQLAVVEYVAYSHSNRTGKKKGLFSKLVDRFKCVAYN